MADKTKAPGAAALPEWSPPKLDAAGHELCPHGYPVSGPARAKALAAKGETADPLGIVSANAIAVYQEA